MTLSFIAPSFLDKRMPCISILLVMPATTMFPYSSNKTRAGRFFTANVSANWICARTTSPGLCMLPCLVFLIVPELFHLCLLYFMQKFIVLVFFLHVLEHHYHVFEDRK